MQKLNEAHKPFRTTFNKNKDSIVYVDDIYIIIAKDSEITGNLTSPIDISMIGISGIREALDHLVSKEDRNEIIDKLISELEMQKYDRTET